MQVVLWGTKLNLFNLARVCKSQTLLSSLLEKSMTKEIMSDVSKMTFGQK